MWMRNGLILAATLGLASGCPTPGRGNPDAGGAHDSGSRTDDAGTDSGTPPDDAGTPPDGGMAARCVGYDPNRLVFWGDLHAHTEYSLDAASFGTPTDPAGAYGFAQGRTVQLSPLKGVPRSASIDRPLDFVAMTDHSEFLGQTAGSGGSKMAAWTKIQEAAAQANDSTSACKFTSLIAYEWSGKVGGTWIHRNVVFGSDVVPEIAADSVTYPTPQKLWAQLDATCLGGAGCSALVIPHNANYSMGLQYLVPDSVSVQEATTRAKYELLTEVYQHKGSSECEVGVGGTTDPLCQFEQQFPIDCTQAPDQGGGYCKAGNFIRNGLRRGLELQTTMSVNPLKMGIVGATDNHNATPGHVDKATYVGQAGSQDADVLDRTDPTKRFAFQSQGGITGVWAEQNDRHNIYQALSRREVYATSGPRIPVRFFGGFALPSDLCSRANLAEVAYQSGVPMGGDLPAPPSAGAKPGFVVWAQKDPGSARQKSVGLQRIQIIKGWSDSAGVSQEKVVDVIGSGSDGATLNPATCATTGGQAELCSMWTDIAFDPTEHAFYYARVLEEKSCTVHQYDCNSITPASARPASCSDGKLTLVDQDRAWSSPIWSSP